MYKIKIDSGSFGASSGIYNTDNALVSASFVKPEFSVLDAIQQIAEIGVARIYNVNDVLFYDIYRQPTSDPFVIFSDEHNNADGITLISHPATESIEKERIKKLCEPVYDWVKTLE